MTPERWRHVTELFHAALARDASARAGYLDQACAGDRPLREEVDAMLSAHVMPVDASLTHTPRLASGTMVGAYRIAQLIGAGGMGEVYRAHDTTLGRDVAIKVLPALFAADPERRRRFEREARLLAALNHPHISAIHGLEAIDGVPALVLELVEGPTLADRIARGRIPVDEALPIAREITEALEAAHERGIIHRDLKPANIKVTRDGHAKVLDFGLAKVLAGDGSGSDVSQLPMATATALRPGTIVGTPAYMSPEQARGQATDKRADIWAFGCVLYEMLTGERAFGGDDVPDTLTCIMTKEPDWTALPPGTPAPVRRLLGRCLDKNPAVRLRDISDARLEIRDASRLPLGETPTTPAGRLASGRRLGRPATIGVAVGAFIAGVALWSLTPPGPSVPPTTTRFALQLPLELQGPKGFAISRDGRRIVYYRTSGGTRQLFARPLDQLDAVAIQGTDDTEGSFFLSPEGEWVGFSSLRDRTIKRVRLDGGPPTTIGTMGPGAVAFRGISWGPNGLIVAATGSGPGLMKLSNAGGTPEPLTRPERDTHSRPQVLPAGDAVLFTIERAGMPARIAVLVLATGEQRVLLDGDDAHFVAASGHLLFRRGRSLYAAPFDPQKLAVSGDSIAIVDGVIGFDVSDGGTLVYRPVPKGDRRSLVWVDRHGREEAIKVPPRAYLHPRISPDGTRVAVGAENIWIWDFRRETFTPLTFGPSRDLCPVWTPDGRYVLFCSNRPNATNMNIFWQAADGTGAVERLTQSASPQIPTATSPDGTRLMFTEIASTGDLMMLTLDKERRLEPLVRAPGFELAGRISPDGRWLAYQSTELGRADIYVRPFSDPGSGHWRVSSGGGIQPVWARSSEELFYLDSSGALMGVRADRAPTWVAGTPTKLLESHYYSDFGSPYQQYDVSLDGSRFLMIKPSDDRSETDPNSIIVVQNWLEELKRLVPRN